MNPRQESDKVFSATLDYYYNFGHWWDLDKEIVFTPAQKQAIVTTKKKTLIVERNRHHK